MTRPTTKLSTEQEDQVYSLWLKRVPKDEIAQQVGVNRNTVGAAWP